MINIEYHGRKIKKGLKVLKKIKKTMNITPI